MLMVQPILGRQAPGDTATPPAIAPTASGTELATEWQWVQSRDGQTALAHGTDATALLPRDDEVVLVLPVLATSWHQLTLPKINTARLRQALDGLLQAELGGLVGHAVLRMLVAHEALFLDRRDQLAVDVQGGGRVMAERAGQAENGQCHGKASLQLRADDAAGTGGWAKLSFTRTKPGIIATDTRHGYRRAPTARFRHKRGRRASSRRCRAESAGQLRRKRARSRA